MFEGPMMSKHTGRQVAVTMLQPTEAPATDVALCVDLD